MTSGSGRSTPPLCMRCTRRVPAQRSKASLDRTGDAEIRQRGRVRLPEQLEDRRGDDDVRVLAGPVDEVGVPLVGSHDPGDRRGMFFAETLVAVDQAPHPFGGIEVAEPDFVELPKHSRPVALLEQEIVPFRYNEPDRARDRDAPRDRLFPVPFEGRDVDDIVLVLMQPPEQGGVACGVEGLGGPLAVAQAEALELDVREVKAVHGHLSNPRTRRATRGGYRLQQANQVLGEGRLAGPRTAGDAQDCAATASDERARPRRQLVESHLQVKPPSIGRDTPVIMAAPSLSRKTIGAAISSSVAQRPSGIALRNGSLISSRPQYPADIGVMTTVGFTLFTRMLYLPSSSAETRVMLSRAALEDAYEMCPSRATRLAWLDTLTIEPPTPRRIIEADVYLVTRRAPRALMLMTLSKTAISVSIGVAISPPNPPQLTTP